MSNRFEKHSRLTLFIVFAVICFFLLIAFEKLLGLSMGHVEEQVRHIRLKEHSPLLDRTMTPLPADLKLTENLENKPFPFRTDQNGFIQPSNVYENPDISIAFIGGSTTECMYVEEDKRFPYLVAKLLSESGKKVNSINSGVSGNDSLNSLNIYLNKIIPQQPDIAVMMHNINDLSLLLYESSYWNSNPYRSPIIVEDKSIKSFLKSILPNTYEFLFRIKANFTGHVDEFSEKRGEQSTIGKPEILEKFADNLETFIAISKARNIQPVLMTMANRFTENPDKIISEKTKKLQSIGLDYSTYKSLFDTMNNQIRKVASENNILLIDLAKHVPQSSKYMVDTVHFSNYGSEFVARYIAEKLKNEARRTH